MTRRDIAMTSPTKNRSSDQHGIRCPRCSALSAATTNTRRTVGGTWRSKRCRECGEAFTTYEVVAPREFARSRSQVGGIGVRRLVVAEEFAAEGVDASDVEWECIPIKRPND
jgi:RecJ-like exonuclease